MLTLNLVVDIFHLPHVEFTCQYYNICKLSIETKRFNIGDIKLGAQMYLHTYLMAIQHDSHIAGNHSRDFCFDGSVNNLVHHIDIFTIDDGIDCEIALQPMLVTDFCYFLQVIYRKGIGRM